MRNLKFSRGKFSKFMSSRGFYVAIAVCLVGAGVATWLAVDRTINSIENSNSRIIENESIFNEFPSVEEVEKKETTIPVPSAPSSSSSTPSVSSAPESKPEEPSISVEQPQESPTLSYSLPLKGNILNQYSNGELVKNVTLNDWRTHDGVDIAGDKGAEVLAAAEGIVSEVKSDALWGTMVVIDHIDGRQTIYAGLSQVVPVQTGDSVMAKQVIGSIEGVPCELSDGPHIHFAMKQDGAYCDPLSMIAQS